jgi:biotin carboxyl carrier protein
LAGRDVVPIHALAAALATQADHRSRAPVLGSLPSGWRNNRSGDQTSALTLGDRSVRTAYRIGRSGLVAAVDGTELPALRLWSASPTSVDLEVDGVRQRLEVTRHGSTVYVDSARGHTALVEDERFPDPAGATTPGSLLAPMPGTVVRVEVTVGDIVEVGARIIAIEAMKMEHAIAAPAGGRVIQINVGVGDQVDSGLVLVVLEEVDSA